jgi:formylglycine-generating enzyme required for sulfatase activity
MPRLLTLAALIFAFPAHAEVAFDWITIGDPGNACDTQSEGCFGAVAGTYRISEYETTNTQYAEFLNAVAGTDTNALYNTEMGTGSGGITRSGSSGSFTYSVISGREQLPVNFVSFWDALRFANWLHNGQPTGAQGNATTEDGAYTLTPTGIANNTIARNPEAAVFVPSEDEWYKAAYYKGGGTSAGYWDYPAASDTAPSAEPPAGTDFTNGSANYNNVLGDLTDVGAYTAKPSDSAYGTFDQGGNVWEWNEAIVFGSNRGLRGGGFNSSPVDLGAAIRNGFGPPDEADVVGFRVASSVQPVPSLSPVGLLVLAAGLLGLVGYRRARP